MAQPVPGTTEFGFVGLGAMGGRMVTRLLNAGCRVSVYDVDPRRVGSLVALGATSSESPRAVADHAEIVMVSLPTPEIVLDVVAGPEGAGRGNAIRVLVDFSTTGIAVTEEIDAHLRRLSIAFVDAPVSGGTRGAETGTLTIMAAADPTALEAVRPVLERLGVVIHVGTRPGQGQIAKVANNMLSASAIAITAEALTIGARAGIDPATLLEVFNGGSGRNTATSDKFPRAVLTRSFDVGFRLSLMAKDLCLYRDAADRFDVPIDLGSQIAAIWLTAQAELEDGADCTRIVRLFERASNTTLESRRSVASE